MFKFWYFCIYEFTSYLTFSVNSIEFCSSTFKELSDYLNLSVFNSFSYYGLSLLMIAFCGTFFF